MSAVRSLLGNPFYVGDIVYKGQVVVQGQHEPVIDRDLFDRVQTVLEQRALRPKSYAAAPPRVYMLSGIGVCAGCGSPLHVHSTKRHQHAYYRCSSRNHDVGCPDRFAAARSDAVESQIAGAVEAMRLPSQWCARVEELVESAAAASTIDRSKLDERIARARQGFLSGVLDEESAKAAVDQAARELAAVAQPVAAGAVSAGDALVDVHELWPRMTADERRNLVRMTVDAVAVDLACGEVRGMLPKGALRAAVSRDRR